MSGAGQMPRPTAFTVFAGAYRAFFAGFLAFIPTLLVFCLTYFLVVLLAYQIDPSIADSAADNDSDNLSVDWLSPLTWINLVFVPCSIWWHRFVWTGETGQLWSNVFSRRGANYCLLTLVLLLGNNISIHAVGAIKDSLEWPVYAFLLCFAGVANIVIFIVSIPVFVSWAVGYRESVWVSLRHIRGNFWYCLVVHFLVFLPWLVLGIASALFLDDVWTISFTSEQIVFGLLIVVSGALAVCAQTIIFRWMVGGPMPVGVRPSGKREEQSDG